VAFSVTVQNDAYPDDQTFEVIGLGEFTNGQARDVTEEEERAFVSANQKPVDEAIGENQSVSVSGSTTIDNMDEVLGVDISDTPASPEEAILNNPCVSDEDPFKKQMLEAQAAEQAQQPDQSQPTSPTDDTQVIPPPADTPDTGGGS
jgi:hypothetical protein